MACKVGRIIMRIENKKNYYPCIRSCKTSIVVKVSEITSTVYIWSCGYVCDISICLHLACIYLRILTTVLKYEILCHTPREKKFE